MRYSSLMIIPIELNLFPPWHRCDLCRSANKVSPLLEGSFPEELEINIQLFSNTKTSMSYFVFKYLSATIIIPLSWTLSFAEAEGPQ